MRRVILEISKKITPNGNRYVQRPYPKDDETRDIQVSADLCQLIREHMVAYGIRDDALLFSTQVGTPLSRNTSRTRVWLPALNKAGLKDKVRFNDLRGAHAAGYAGGAEAEGRSKPAGHDRARVKPFGE